jgi:hypothetical protein
MSVMAMFRQLTDSGERYFRRPFFAVEVAFDLANFVGTVP